MTTETPTQPDSHREMNRMAYALLASGTLVFCAGTILMGMSGIANGLTANAGAWARETAAAVLWVGGGLLLLSQLILFANLGVFGWLWERVLRLGETMGTIGRSGVSRYEASRSRVREAHQAMADAERQAARESARRMLDDGKSLDEQD